MHPIRCDFKINFAPSSEYAVIAFPGRPQSSMLPHNRIRFQRTGHIAVAIAKVNRPSQCFFCILAPGLSKLSVVIDDPFVASQREAIPQLSCINRFGLTGVNKRLAIPDEPLSGHFTTSFYQFRLLAQVNTEFFHSQHRHHGHQDGSNTKRPP